MTLHRLASMSALIVASALIGACSREPVVEDNAQPFSVVGVQLGMAKDSAIEAIGFSFCDNEAPDRAKCFFEDSERDLRFFGRHIDLATAELRDPYTTITRISFNYDGDRPNPYAIEDDWGLDGRCLNEWDLDRIVDKSGSSDLAAVARQLREWGAAPTTGDFVCVSTEGEFVEISDFGVDQGNVEMFYINDTLFRLFGYVFEAREASEAAKREQNEQIFGEPES